MYMKDLFHMNFFKLSNACRVGIIILIKIIRFDEEQATNPY